MGEKPTPDTHPTLWDPQKSWPNFDPLGHWNTHNDMRAIRDLTRALVARGDCQHIAIEVGTWAGQTARYLAEADWRVFCIDQWNGNEDSLDPLPKDYSQEEAAAAFSNNMGSHLLRNVFPVMCDSNSAFFLWPRDLKADFIFLDALHTHEAVRTDIDRWGSLVRPGGILAVHDYGSDAFPGIAQAVQEAMPDFQIAGDSVAWIQV